VREQIGTTAVWCDKTETLRIVEPLHYTGCHDVLSELNYMSADLWELGRPPVGCFELPVRECRNNIESKLSAWQGKFVSVGSAHTSALLGRTLELEAGPERHDPASRNGRFFPCFWITAGTSGFIAQLEVAEPGDVKQRGAFSSSIETQRPGNMFWPQWQQGFVPESLEKTSRR